ncbi:MAG: ferrous iron transport protein A [Bacteroidetes bacterium]|nr:ferrous iron transport protein A [Bacteroidota bacterium]
MKLTDFEVNKKGIITEILDNPVASKLMEYGILPGASFYVLNKASFNGPIFIRVGSNRIVLRRTEAAAVIVE